MRRSLFWAMLLIVVLLGAGCSPQRDEYATLPDSYLYVTLNEEMLDVAGEAGAILKKHLQETASAAEQVQLDRFELPELLFREWGPLKNLRFFCSASTEDLSRKPGEAVPPTGFLMVVTAKRKLDFQQDVVGGLKKLISPRELPEGVQMDSHRIVLDGAEVRLVGDYVLLLGHPDTVSMAAERMDRKDQSRLPAEIAKMHRDTSVLGGFQVIMTDRLRELVKNALPQAIPSKFETYLPTALYVSLQHSGIFAKSEIAGVFRSADDAEAVASFLKMGFPMLKQKILTEWGKSGRALSGMQKLEQWELNSHLTVEQNRISASDKVPWPGKTLILKQMEEELRQGRLRKLSPGPASSGDASAMPGQEAQKAAQEVTPPEGPMGK